MEQFVYTVSHDLKSPIVTTLGFIGCIREDLATGDTKEVGVSLDRLESSANRMRESVDDLLQLSRVGRVRQEPRQIAVKSLLDGIVSELQPRIDAAGVELQVDVTDCPLVWADPVWLRELFENLLTNALKYGSGNASPRIEIGAVADPAGPRYYVRDNGVGIDPRYHDKVFELFQRLESREEQEGTGVGLATVKRIMENHGGRVWIESQPEQGATFWLAFPPADAQQPPAQAA